MPLELGLFLGAKKYGSGQQKEKVCLILDTEKYRYQQFISDIAGQDIEAHGNDVETCIRIVRRWLNEASGRKTLPGYRKIYERYQLFKKELPEICRELEVDLDEVSFNDFAQFTSVWLKEQSPH
jgi:hypothetical protein